MLGFYNYTVILTYVGMLASFLGIMFAIDGSILQALLCLMISGFCDMFDGRVASTMKRTRNEKNFGIQIDSLSDLICLGVLPAVIVHTLSPRNIIVSCICGLYLLCALILLLLFCAARIPGYPIKAVASHWRPQPIGLRAFHPYLRYISDS
ncbi:MAG: CDP-alcohol phosphatidyltransferase family protein [Oscillospiraceae bacterium]|nr:CDP-alcohol phosphatidyltransferase family protein [Oscillospiraceae bacterium]